MKRIKAELKKLKDIVHLQEAINDTEKEIERVKSKDSSHQDLIAKVLQLLKKFGETDKELSQTYNCTKQIVKCCETVQSQTNMTTAKSKQLISVSQNNDMFDSRL